MNAQLNAARVGLGILAIGFSGSAAMAAMPHDGTSSAITLVSTDTSEAYPFATLVAGDVTYHVTEGDVIKGLYVRHITPGHVTLSDNETLVATQPNLDTGSEPQIASGR